ncbi:hypothetical protein FBU31_001923 [Coemansia sp. 'formosensis']|nr:hypothetical protein FBU31_001923 [Coemansia sp. 'formosensis']
MAKSPVPVLPSHAKPSKVDFLQLIDYYIGDYCVSAGLANKQYKKMGGIASYISTQMVTAYKVNIKQRYGERLRYAVNSILNTRQRAKKKRKDLEKKEEPQSEITAQCKREIWAPAREVKEAIGMRVPVVYKLDKDGNPEVDDDGNLIVDENKVRVFEQLSPVLQCYDINYEFDKDNIYYDIKAHPAKHLRAFSKLCQIIEDNNGGIRKKKGRNKKANSIQCFPLRTTFVPCHMTINSRIIREHILQGDKGITSKSSARKVWGAVLNRRSKPFNRRRNLEFGGSADTDGVAISLRFRTSAVRQAKLKSAAKGAATKKANKAATAAAAAAAASGKSAEADNAADDEWADFMDVDADITADVGTSAATGAATRASTSAATGAKKKRRTSKMGADCRYVHQLTPSELKEYMPQAIVDDLGRNELHCIMSMDSTSADPQILRYTRKQWLKEARSWRFKKIREKVKNAYPDDAINKAEQRLKGYDPCSMDPAKFRAYVEARAGEWDLLSKFYAETPTCHAESKHQIHRTLRREGFKPRTHPLHRKLNLSAYLNKKQAEDRFMRNVKAKFVDKRVIGMGNWSASMAKYHEPIPGKSWRDLFKHHGFRVFLIDEFRTSLLCPSCDSDLEKFKNIDNPRRYKAKKRSKVLCHGLLRCTNQECLRAVEKYKDTSKSRLYNRNVAAVVNFKRIITSLLKTGDIPVQFKRSTPRKSAAKRPESGDKGNSDDGSDESDKSNSDDESEYSGPVATTSTSMSMSLRSAEKRTLSTNKQPPFKRSRKGVS